MSNKAVAAKIIKAWGHIGSIPKNGKNSNFNYKFVREEDAADALRNAFMKVGLSCIPSVEKIDRSIFKTAKGTEMQHVVVTMKFTLTDQDTGEHDSFVMVGEAMDNLDKAVYKAITGCTKYAYVKLAMSGAEDNEDEDTGERVGEQDRQQQQNEKTVQSGATYRKPEQSNQSARKSDSTAEKPAEQPAKRSEDKPAGKPAEQQKPAGNNNPAPSAQAKTSIPPAQDQSQIPIMEDTGHITAVVPAMKGKPAAVSFKSDSNGTVIPLSFDTKTIDVPSLLKLQSSKSKVKVTCDVSSGNPHLMHIQGV